MTAYQKATDVLAAMLSSSPKALRSFQTEKSLIEAFGGDESMVPANIMQDWRNMEDSQSFMVLSPSSLDSMIIFMVVISVGKR